jgi:hypothetical protein
VWFNQYSGILLKTPTKTFAIDPVDVKPNTCKMLMPSCLHMNIMTILTLILSKRSKKPQAVQS